MNSDEEYEIIRALYLCLDATASRLDRHRMLLPEEVKERVKCQMRAEAWFRSKGYPLPLAGEVK